MNMGWLATPSLGLVVEDKPTELSCTGARVKKFNGDKGLKMKKVI